MKLAKYAQIVKREGCCSLLNVAGDGVWLATRSAVYRASDLPQIESGEEMRAVLDLTEKDWKKIYYKTNECESLDNVLGMYLRNYDEQEAYAKKMQMQAVYKGRLATGLLCSDGELVFYNESLLGPVAKEIEDSDYVETVVRKYANGVRYVVIKNGFEVIAAVMPLNIVSQEYLEKLAEFEVHCTQQYAREKARLDFAAAQAAAEQTEEEEAEQIAMEGTQDGQNEN